MFKCNLQTDCLYNLNDSEMVGGVDTSFHHLHRNDIQSPVCSQSLHNTSLWLIKVCGLFQMVEWKEVHKETAILRTFQKEDIAGWSFRYSGSIRYAMKLSGMGLDISSSIANQEGGYFGG